MTSKIKDIVADILELEVEDIKDDALILDDLGADSIAVMEIVMELEGEFDVEVPTDDIINLTTVNDIVKYLETLK